MLIFAVLSCAAAWWVIQSKVVRPLHLLALRLQDIAEGEGDLTRRIEVNGNKDEIDEVGIWFNVFIGRMEDIVRQVAEHASTLGAAALELAPPPARPPRRPLSSRSRRARISRDHERDVVSDPGDQPDDAERRRGCSQGRRERALRRTDGQATVQTIGDLLTSNQQTSSRIEELGRSSDAIGKDHQCDQRNCRADQPAGAERGH
jgi:methyl-accepting chemotaxis protein